LRMGSAIGILYCFCPVRCRASCGPRRRWRDSSMPAAKY